MANVDPFVIQWPQQWVEDPEIGPVVNYLNKFLHDLFLRTGGGSDLIEEADEKITANNSRVSRNAARIDSLEFVRFRVVEVTADYTAQPFEIVICNNVVPITITLDTSSILDDQIHVKRKPTAAEVNVVGAIDGGTERTINIPNWSDYYVFGETEWAVI